MYCTNCGFDNLPEARFCEECGAPVVAFEMGGMMPVPKKKSNALIPAIAVISVAAIAVVLCFVFGIFKPGYEKALDKAIEAMNKADAEALFEVMVPPCIEELSDVKKSDMLKLMESGIKEYEEEYGDDVRFSIKIKDVKKYKKEDINEINEQAEENGGPSEFLDDLVIVEVEATIKGDDIEETNDLEMPVVKCEGEWYYFPFITEDSIENMLDD